LLWEDRLGGVGVECNAAIGEGGIEDFERGQIERGEVAKEFWPISRG
jgi:hypothetical protein